MGTCVSVPADALRTNKGSPAITSAASSPKNINADTNSSINSSSSNSNSSDGNAFTNTAASSSSSTTTTNTKTSISTSTNTNTNGSSSVSAGTSTCSSSRSTSPSLSDNDIPDPAPATSSTSSSLKLTEVPCGQTATADKTLTGSKPPHSSRATAVLRASSMSVLKPGVSPSSPNSPCRESNGARASSSSSFQRSQSGRVASMRMAAQMLDGVAGSPSSSKPTSSSSTPIEPSPLHDPGGVRACSNSNSYRRSQSGRALSRKVTPHLRPSFRGMIARNFPRSASWVARVRGHYDSSAEAERDPMGMAQVSLSMLREDTESRRMLMGHEPVREFSYEELNQATDGFSEENILGFGGFGPVYRGEICEESRDGQTGSQREDGESAGFNCRREDGGREAGEVVEVAVKRLDSSSLQGYNEWLTEVVFLRRLRHPQLVRFVGYCDDDERDPMLVYEFMANGSLDRLLFSNEHPPLTWKQRVGIALDTARGLSYLHHEASRPVIFHDLKTSNILLDKNMRAKLSDFGLARHGPTGGRKHVLASAVMGTPGYTAPEYARSGKLTTKSDVYAFGVVLLELITGRRALEPKQPTRHRNLVVWARRYLTDRRKMGGIVDPRLGFDYPLSDVHRLGMMAGACLSLDARARPSMERLVEELEEVCAGMRGDVGASLGAKAVDASGAMASGRDGHPSGASNCGVPGGGLSSRELWPPSASVPWESHLGSVEVQREKEECLVGHTLPFSFSASDAEGRDLRRMLSESSGRSARGPDLLPLAEGEEPEISQPEDLQEMGIKDVATENSEEADGFSMEASLCAHQSKGKSVKHLSHGLQGQLSVGSLLEDVLEMEELEMGLTKSTTLTNEDILGGLRLRSYS